MSDKLLAYLDIHPSVVSIWVNSDLAYTTGPVDGFKKVTRDEALQLCLDVAPADTEKEPPVDTNIPSKESEPADTEKEPPVDTNIKQNKK